MRDVWVPHGQGAKHTLQWSRPVPNTRPNILQQSSRNRYKCINYCSHTRVQQHLAHLPSSHERYGGLHYVRKGEIFHNIAHINKLPTRVSYGSCWYVPICADMCWYGPTCADVCQHIASLSALLIQTILILPSCWHVSAHLDMPTCADTCRHVLICADMCQHVPSRAASLIRTLWSISSYWHVSAHLDMPTCADVPTCADMCRHVPTCTITIGIFDTNPLGLICMLACVSTFGHANMCWYVPTCADMKHHFRHLWYQTFGIYLQAGMCQHMWTCRHVLTCADMCRQVPICANM